MKDYNTILLKISGEALSGMMCGADEQNKEIGTKLSYHTLKLMAQQILNLRQGGKLVAVVLGGGNLLRGKDVSFISPALADNMGMLSTVINGIALSDILTQYGVENLLMSSLPVNTVCEVYNRVNAYHFLQRGRVLILAGGMNVPFFSTDTNALVKAKELNCDLIIKATKVDGVYDRDPVQHADAKFYKHLTYQMLNSNLDNIKVMDATAFTLARDFKIPLVVCSMMANFSQIVRGEGVFTLIE